MGASNGRDYDPPLDYVRAERGGAAAHASIRDGLGKAGVFAILFGVAGLIFGILGLTFGTLAFINTGNVAALAKEVGESASRADIAERRANIAELYAKQVFVELNRLGYAVKTPAEEHSVAPVETP